MPGSLKDIIKKEKKERNWFHWLPSVLIISSILIPADASWISMRLQALPRHSTELRSLPRAKVETGDGKNERPQAPGRNQKGLRPHARRGAVGTWAPRPELPHRPHVTRLTSVWWNPLGTVGSAFSRDVRRLDFYMTFSNSKMPPGNQKTSCSFKHLLRKHRNCLESIFGT